MSRQNVRKSAALMICGGTLDSDITRAGKQVSSTTDAERYRPLLSAIRRKVPQIKLRFVQPAYRIDSSQLTPDYLLKLIKVVYHLVKNRGYTSIIIGVGTDTLAYVAAALGFLFHNVWSSLRAQIILVSGMKAWHEPDSDGLQNIIDAVRFSLVRVKKYICGYTDRPQYATPAPVYSTSITGVFVVSGGYVLWTRNIHKMSHEATDPFREFRLPSRMKCLASFEKVLARRLRRGAVRISRVQSFFERGERVFGREGREGGIWVIGLEECCPDALTKEGKMKAAVTQCMLYPGLKAETLIRLAHEGIEHVILHCYANGTACIEDGEYSIAAAVRELRQRGIQVYAVTQQLGAVSPEVYAVCKTLQEAGCLYVKSYSAETLYTYLLILSQLWDPERVMRKIRYCDEFVQETKSFVIQDDGESDCLIFDE